MQREPKHYKTTIVTDKGVFQFFAAGMQNKTN